MAQAGQTMGNAIAQRGQNQLYSSAYMGEPGAMERLMQLNPAMGQQLVQQQQQAEQLKLEQAAKLRAEDTAKNDKLRKIATENKGFFDDVVKQGAKIATFPEYAQFIEQKREDLRTVIGNDADLLPKPSPELYEQGKQIYGEKVSELDKAKTAKYLADIGKEDGGNGADDPANVREYQFFEKLTQKQKEEFLIMKRANRVYTEGDVSMVASQLTPTGTAISEGPPTTQAEQQKKLTEQQSIKKASEAAAVAAIDLSKEAFTKIAPIRLNLSNYDEAIRLIDEGADTGVISSRFPSMKQASIELDNLQGRLGLDVVGNTTFGALSESELAFALDTALPKKLEGPELQVWLKRKKAAQEKLLAYTERAATYLGTPGNTVAGWIDSQKKDKDAKSDRLEELRNKAGL
jgi:hypothetical protein